MESNSLPEKDPDRQPEPEKDPGAPAETGADEVPPAESLDTPEEEEGGAGGE